MKKISLLLTVCIIAIGTLGGTAFAAGGPSVNGEQEVVTVGEEVTLEEAIAQMEDQIEGDLANEEGIQGECVNYVQLRDEFKVLQRQREETRELLKNIAVRRVKIAALKEKARIRGERVKLEVAGIIEKEIKVFKGIIHRLRMEKHGLWEEFKSDIRQGNIDRAEKTIRKIILTKMLINENLKHMLRFMEIEIEVLN